MKGVLAGQHGALILLPKLVDADDAPVNGDAEHAELHLHAPVVRHAASFYFYDPAKDDGVKLLVCE